MRLAEARKGRLGSTQPCAHSCLYCMGLQKGKGAYRSQLGAPTMVDRAAWEAAGRGGACTAGQCWV